ncbi:general transcription factor IIF subunit 2-like [Lolium rigidum]|uniref:general transcription factor IIF subunit 2-like n=1 Tax=Lolium rigidum TaxID=89674 RepID=UPI001F5D12D5|nr:general transcription factor IIF subunit 2-like [Lolium rigidum]
MAEEAKHLETGRADRSVWLMKCPTIVSQAWQEAAATASATGGPNPNPNPVVAKVILSFDPLSPDEEPKQFKMEMAQTDSGNIPKNYSLNMFQDFVPMCVFSESKQGKHACEGKVGHKFDMEPHKENLSDYAKLCRERTTKSMIKTRKVQVLDKGHGMGVRTLLPLVGGAQSGAKEKKKAAATKPSEQKRTRRDRKDLENILFKLFERQPNWSLKHLMQETDQPEQFLKEIMNDLCVYNKRGPNQGTHELKPEYKKSVEDTSAP